MPKRKERPSEEPKEEEKSLLRTDTVLLLNDPALCDSDLSDEEKETTPVHSPAKKKVKIASEKKGKGKLNYATTTVLRTLDEDGEDVPLVNTLRTASFHTKKILKQQLLREKKAVTPEQQNARKIINILRKSFVPVQKYNYAKQGPSHKWSTKAELTNFQKLLIPLCEATTEVLKKDAMIVRLPSPTYVLGDLHGNYKDLLVFKQNFWNMGIDMTPSRFLFLGDYVDRGPHSLELIAYLFALKVIHPERVILLRGNHEFESQNGDEDYSPCFLDNCYELFTKAIAKKVWKAFNSSFEWMPLAATIDDKIFCCHGGIPRIVQKTKDVLQSIEKINRPILDDDVEASEDKVAMDLLWSDPATVKEEKKLSDGWFGPNDRGGEILVFGQKAVEAFVESTGCTHLIRAHQPPDHGIEYSKSARIITVFSSSHYCGGYNSAAIVLVNEGRLRVATTEQARTDDNDESENQESDVELSSEDEVIVEESYE